MVIKSQVGLALNANWFLQASDDIMTLQQLLMPFFGVARVNLNARDVSMSSSFFKGWWMSSGRHLFQGSAVRCAVPILMAIALASCGAARGGGIPYNPESFGSPDAPSENALARDYRIAPLDKVSVNIFQFEQLSGEYQVDLTGTVPMPLIGSVEAVNLTTEELSERLTQAYGAKYIKDPDISVGIVEATGSTITLEGSVERPGVYPAFGRLSLVQAMAIGGGLADYANPKRIVVFRQVDGRRMAAAFDLTTIRNGTDPDPEVYRGDIIVVDGSGTKRAWRNVLQSVPLLGLFRPI